MKRRVIGNSVTGASHKRKDLPCQDSFAIRNNQFRYSKADNKRNAFYQGMNDDVEIITVADGHGSSSCPYSDRGSSIAVNVFCDIIAEFCYKYRDQMDDLRKYLNSESECIHLARKIDREWKQRVLKDYRRDYLKRTPILTQEEEKKEYPIYKLFGTTLVGMVITKSFAFALQIGDGDINLISEHAVENIIEQEKILGVETHSLSKKDAWKHASTRLLSLNLIEDKLFMFMLSTDGMANSYATENDFKQTCVEYFNIIKEHDIKVIKENLPRWLNETSEHGCGDDISVIFALIES